MGRLRTLFGHPAMGPGIRFGIAGTIVAGVYLGIPVALDGAGVPIEVAIAIAYVIAITLHFNLQRHFVFCHVAEFALTRREQITRYLMMASVQYPTTALATALLPKVLGLSPEGTFVIVSLTISLTVFVVLRTHIFHAGDGLPKGTDLTLRSDRSGRELEFAEWERLGRAGPAGERETGPVEPQVQRDR